MHNQAQTIGGALSGPIYEFNGEDGSLSVRGTDTADFVNLSGTGTAQGVHLSSLTDTQLIALRDQIPGELMRRLEEIDKHAAVLRQSISPVAPPVTATPSKRRHPTNGSVIPAKYRDKQGNTWSGRGVKPLWLQAAMKAGCTMDMFKVEAVQ